MKHVATVGRSFWVFFVVAAWISLKPDSSGKEPKAQIIENYIATKNAQPQNFYGSVIDQHGKPIVGAKATGTLIRIRGIDEAEAKKVYTAITDRNGNFEFTGLQGWQLGVVVEKEGYQVGQSAGTYKAPNAQNKTYPTQRAVITLWKLRGAEPMTACSISTTIPCDGTATSFNLLPGRGKGDLTVTLTRKPLNIDRSKPFDWTVTLGIVNGGLVENTDAFPNEAPAVGYQQSVTVTMSPSDENWTPDLSRSYYFKSGSTYGRMTINITANFQPPPTFFGANIYNNPSGSRNLEFDPSKQINQ